MDDFKETKVCSKCKEEKSVFAFWRNAAAPDGLKNECRRCVKQHPSQKSEKALKRHEDRMVWRNRL